MTVGVGGERLLEAPQQVWRGEAEGELITALFAGKQMWVAASSRGRDEAETFQLTYLDFKSEPLPSLQAAKQAAPAFARAVLGHLQSLITEAAPTQPEPKPMSNPTNTDDTDRTNECPEDAVALSLDYDPAKQTLVYRLAFGGTSGAESSHSLKAAWGALMFAHMTDDPSQSPALQDGIRFEGDHYSTPETLAHALADALCERGFVLSLDHTHDPTLILSGLLPDDRAPRVQSVAPTQQATQPESAKQPATPIDRPSKGVFGFEAGADPYTQVMFGQHAQHVPAWLYVQSQGNGTVLFVGASRSTGLTWGGTKTHQFMLGELIARPHFVVESDGFAGHGISGLARADHLDFVEAEDRVVLCDPLGLVATKGYNHNMTWS